MAYITGDVPVGASIRRACRISALDMGRLMPAAATPISIRRPGTNSPACSVSPTISRTSRTQYQNGVDMHFDWGWSQFLSKQHHGRVGRLRLQAALLRQRVGRPGRLLQVAECSASGRRSATSFRSAPRTRATVNLKGYKEFGAEHRPEGWNVCSPRDLAGRADERAASATSRNSRNSGLPGPVDELRRTALTRGARRQRLLVLLLTAMRSSG